MSRLPQTRRSITMLFRAFSLAVLLVGLGFAAYAGVQWLQTARWQPLTVNGALANWPTTREWTAHPHSWLGLRRVVGWLLPVPVFVIVTLLGAALVTLAVQAPGDGKRHVSNYY